MGRIRLVTAIFGIKDPSDEERASHGHLDMVVTATQTMCGNSCAYPMLLKPIVRFIVLDLASMSVIDDRSYRRSSCRLRRKLH